MVQSCTRASFFPSSPFSLTPVQPHLSFPLPDTITHFPPSLSPARLSDGYPPFPAASSCSHLLCCSYSPTKKTSSSLPKQLIESLEILCICTHEKREFLPYCFFPGLNLLPSPGQEVKVCSVPRTVLHSKDG